MSALGDIDDVLAEVGSLLRVTEYATCSLSNEQMNAFSWLIDHTFDRLKSAREMLAVEIDAGKRRASE